RLGSHVWIRWTAAPLAIARGRAGDMASAHELIESASRVGGDDGGAPTDANSPNLTLGERHLWLARAELALMANDPEPALAIVDARLAREHEAYPSSELGVPRLHLARAEALTGLGRYDDAKLALDVARTQAIAHGARPILWRIETAVGNLHRAQRQRLDARKAFDVARTIADELATQIPDDLLRGSFLTGLGTLIPSGPQPSRERAARDALGGLTKRERDVAELVAQGKANRAIARQLGIGERTVEGYVTSALSKLDLTSRTQLAAWAIEKGVASRR
ncbi:MAG TPA: response regulator transcription factor, partial [Gemmatimonadaceae bacterium]|nr:response regulator transcription factor [Gemmatimonadaceae bacterium]